MKPATRKILTITLSTVWLIIIAETTLAQEDKIARVPGPNPIVTGTATADRVRIAAPSAVVQLRLEVYDLAGQKRLDTEQRGGNVLDWHLQEGTGQRVADGTYLCVVTIKDLSGRLSQKLGLITVSGQSTMLRSAPVAELSAAQAQAVGPIESEEESLTVMPAEDAQPVTVVANNGDEAQLARTRGPLTFRVGDFFSGNDKEQMRLTEEGNLGIGTAKPKAKLDVAGMIRAREGFLFSDGSTLNVNDKGALTLTNSNGSVIPNVAGSGTQNQVVKWTDNAGTLGDSAITEVGGRVGIGVTNPTYKLVVGPDIGPGLTTSDLTVSRGAGQSVSVFAGATGAHGMNFGWDEANQRAFVNAPVQSPITFTHGGVSERMRIATNGNVGIGTNNAQSLLDVAGNINTSTQYNIGGNRVLAVNGSAFNSNTFMGLGAGQANPTVNSSNSFFGGNAGQNTTSGGFNAFFGNDAGQANTTGANNSFFGGLAGNSNTACCNAFFGGTSGLSNTTGQFNTFMGYSAGFNHQAGAGGFTNLNNTGSSNTLIGALASVTDPNPSNATAIGANALVSQSNSIVLGGVNGVNGATADTNVGIGTTAPLGRLDVRGDILLGLSANPTFLGSNSLFIANDGGTPGNNFRIDGANDDLYLIARSESSSGAGIIFRTAPAFGGEEDRVSIDPNGNVGIGTSSPSAKLDVAGNVNASTQYNIGGSRVLTVTGDLVPNSNTFAGVGAGALTTPSANNASGHFNSFFGNSAGASNTFGASNSFFGNAAGLSNTGSSNSFFGASAGLINGTGSANSFFGSYAGQANNTGGNNSFFGTGAGQNNRTGGDNSFFGFAAGTNNMNGVNNSFFGNFAGFSNETGNSNTFLGAFSNGAAGITNATAIGANAEVIQSNSLVLGDNVNVGIGTIAPQAKLDLQGGADSDGSFDPKAIALSYRDGGFRHWIRTRHNSVLGSGNAIDFFVNNSSTSGGSTGPGTGNIQSLTLDSGNVGIGTTAPKAKLEVTGGNILIGNAGQGLILKSPNGSVCRLLTIDNAGSLVTSAIACP
jgi:hypothetical protein